MSVTAGVNDAVIEIRDKLGGGKSGQTKVKRYWPEKAPEFADEVEEDADIRTIRVADLERTFTTHEDRSTYIVHKDDCRLRCLAELRAENKKEVRLTTVGFSNPRLSPPLRRRAVGRRDWIWMRRVRMAWRRGGGGFARSCSRGSRKKLSSFLQWRRRRRRKRKSLSMRLILKKSEWALPWLSLCSSLSPSGTLSLNA